MCIIALKNYNYEQMNLNYQERVNQNIYSDKHEAQNNLKPENNIQSDKQFIVSDQSQSTDSKIAANHFQNLFEKRMQTQINKF